MLGFQMLDIVGGTLLLALCVALSWGISCGVHWVVSKVRKRPAWYLANKRFRDIALNALSDAFFWPWLMLFVALAELPLDYPGGGRFCRLPHVSCDYGRGRVDALAGMARIRDASC
jgi:hypothetical protein